MRFKLAAVASGVAVALALSACGGDPSSGTAAGNGPAKITMLSGQAVDTGGSLVMKNLTTAYANGSSIEVEYLSANMDQKIQLLASQNNLPTVFHIGTPAQVMDLYEKGQIVDLEQVLTRLGVYDQLNPLAVDIIKKLYDGKLLALPVELGIEGFWYNKKIFRDNGLSAPQTWDDVLAAAATLHSKGIQPFAASGKQGWPITRLVSGYIYRSVGPDAFAKVKDGSAKLTDPPYLAGAQAVADLGSKGYFGKGVAALDYAPAEDLFLQGKAAMFYMGTWALADFNDVEKNKIGADNVGFFPFPAVSGGAGNADQTPANAGLPLAVSTKTLTPAVEAWLKYVVQNYGNEAMQSQEIITGLKTTVEPTSPLVKETVDRIGKINESVGWFEAAMGSKATEISQRNAAGLVTGTLTPRQFMEKVQAAQ